jgi:hypothetical protein
MKTQCEDPKAKNRVSVVLYECSVEPEYVLPARLLTPHRPYSRPDWFGVAQFHTNFQYPDPGHWSQQMDWLDAVDKYERPWEYAM